MRGRTIYRRLRRLFLPRDLDEEWGEEMEHLLSHRLRGTRGATRAWIWVRALADLVVHGLAERRRAPAEREGRMDRLGQDLRYALRGLGRARALSAIALLTLALGIGATTATFSVVHAVLLRDLPYDEPERLVTVWPSENFNVAMTFEALAAAPALSSIAGVSNWTLTLVGVGEPLEVAGAKVSAGYFEILGVRPALGRTFRPEEELAGSADVVVLSHDFWVRVLGADPSVIGRALDLSGADYPRRTIVGVMPPGFRPTFGEPELWIPLERDPAAVTETDESWYVNHRLARLRAGASLEQANEQIRAFARDVQSRIPTVLADEDVARADVRFLIDSVTEDYREALLAAMGAVVLVLLIACANVANLLLVRGEARQRDLAVRSALGAGRQRLVRMLLAEGALIGVAGGLLGVAAARGILALLLARAPADFPRIDEVALDGTVLVFALGLTVGATLLAGLYPALRASRGGATSTLTAAARGRSSRAGSRLSTTLVGAEIALAVVVAVGSGLMLRSVERLVAVDTGLDVDGVLTLRPNPPGARYTDGPGYRAYYADVLERVRAVPGVESAGAIHLLPGTGGSWSFPTHIDGRDIPEGEVVPSVSFRAVRPGYFETVGVPVRAGRLLEAADGPDSERVVLVNQSFVNRFLTAGEALGRSLRIFNREATPYRIVGVVGDVRQHGRASEPRPEMYFSHDQVPWNQMSFWLMVRFDDAEPLRHADAVRAAVWSVDPDVPISGVQSLDEVFGASMSDTAFLATLLASFGALSLILGGVGVFGVTSHLVGQRAAEFGVRIALGSSRGRVLRAGVAGIGVPIALGLVVGVAGARASSGILESVLYGVSPTDPVTFGAVALLLGGAAAVAALLPAWRASAVDPVTVLDAE